MVIITGFGVFGSTVQITVSDPIQDYGSDSVLDFFYTPLPEDEELGVCPTCGQDMDDDDDDDFEDDEDEDTDYE